MLQISRWLLAILWIIFLSFGIFRMREAMSKIEPPQIEPPSEVQNLRLRQFSELQDLRQVTTQNAALVMEYLVTNEDKTKKKWDALRTKDLPTIKDNLVKLRLEMESDEHFKIVEQLDTILIRLEELMISEEELLNKANSPENQPALESFDNELTSRLNQMNERLSKTIELESKLENRKQIISSLVKTREQLNVTMNHLQIFLLRGSEKSQEAFETHFTELQQVNQELQAYYAQFTKEQKKSFEGFQPLFNEWQEALPQTVTMRGKQDWNQSHYLFKQRIRPDIQFLDQQISGLVETFRDRLLKPDNSANQILTEHFDEQSKEANNAFLLIVIGSVLGFISILLSLIPASNLPKSKI